MEHTFKSSDERDTGYGHAYLIPADSPDFLVGRLLTIIEALGLPSRQEKSARGLIRSEVYGCLTATSPWVESNLNNILHDFSKWYGELDLPTSVPSGPYKLGEYTLTFKTL